MPYPAVWDQRAMTEWQAGPPPESRIGLFIEILTPDGQVFKLKFCPSDATSWMPGVVWRDHDQLLAESRAQTI